MAFSCFAVSALAGPVVNGTEITHSERTTFRGGAKGFLITTMSTDPDDPFSSAGRVTCRPARGDKPNIIWIFGDGTVQTDVIQPGNEDNEPRYIQGSYAIWYHLCGRRR